MLCSSILEKMELKAEQEKRLSLSTTELLSMSEEISKLIQTKEENDKYNETISDLEIQIEMLTNKLDQSKQRTKSELEYLNLVLENRNEELQQIQELNENKETALKQLKRTVQKQETEIDKKSSLLNRYEQEIADLKEELEKKTKKLKTLKADKEKHTNNYEVEEKANRIVKFDEDVTVKVFEVEDPTEALEKEITRMKRENDKLVLKLEEVNWQMRAKDIMISNGEDTMQALESQAEEIENLQDKIEELEEKLKKTEQEKTSSETEDEKTPFKVEVEATHSDKEDVDKLNQKIQELETKIREIEDINKDENKWTPSLKEISQIIVKPVDECKPADKLIVEEEQVETTAENVSNTEPSTTGMEESESNEEKCLSMLEHLRDAFFEELQLKASQQEGEKENEKFERILQDLQAVLETVRKQQVPIVLEECFKENANKGEIRINSLKKMNSTLKEEIQQKTENYGNTVKSLEIKNHALLKSITEQQQLNEEVTVKFTAAEEARKTMDSQVKDLRLKMMVRDSEVERLKGILEDVKRNKSMKTMKMKKLSKKDKKKSSSLSNILR